jgi:MEDS: MEthanogen/methylotroph, DcmR Sensory domain
MKATAAPIPFAGSTLGGYRHVCAFFNSLEEEYDTLLPFVRDGLERGERAYHVLPSQYREEHLQQLRSAGIDVAAAQRRRQLEVATPQETYLRGGRFDQDAMLILIQEALETGPTLGFPLTRLIAHAETVLWHPEDWSTINEWIEYETRLNDVLPRFDDPVICTYDANLLSGSIVVDILRTHPVAIIGGLLYENPFFMPPQQFLREVQQRSSAQPNPYRL